MFGVDDRSSDRCQLLLTTYHPYDSNGCFNGDPHKVTWQFFVRVYPGDVMHRGVLDVPQEDFYLAEIPSDFLEAAGGFHHTPIDHFPDVTPASVNESFSSLRGDRYIHDEWRPQSNDLVRAITEQLRASLRSHRPQLRSTYPAVRCQLASPANSPTRQQIRAFNSSSNPSKPSLSSAPARNSLHPATATSLSTPVARSPQSTSPETDSGKSTTVWNDNEQSGPTVEKKKRKMKFA